MSLLLGGDFRQTLPVSPKSSRSEIIALSLVNSYLYPCFKIHKLEHNMRPINDQSQSTLDFTPSTVASSLLDTGDGLLGVGTLESLFTLYMEMEYSLIYPQTCNHPEQLSVLKTTPHMRYMTSFLKLLLEVKRSIGVSI